MSAWGDSELLVELLDRQFNYLLGLSGTPQIIRLPRLLRFLQGEPQTAGILDDFATEAAEARDAYDKWNVGLRAELGRLWESHGPEIRGRLAGVTDDALDAYGSLERFEERLAHTTTATFVTTSDGPEKRSENLARSLHHWWKWADDLAEGKKEPLTGPIRGLGKRLNRLLEHHAFACRRLREAGRSMPWPAYERLSVNAGVTNPRPPDIEDDPAWMTFPLDTRLATNLARADQEGLGGVDGTEVTDVYEEIGDDAKLLHEELRLRVGLARSRLGLVQRYAARCEAFEAPRLRAASAEDSGNAERLLTLDLAKFLFDAGLSPLIDATIGGLRPDLLHVLPTSLFYVEAKQYADANPRSQLTRAYFQVWSTWGRLRKTYPASEAFLVVFRRSGPWVELPSVIHHEGLRLYSVVADISTEAGSRERSNPIRLAESELRPREEETR